MILDANIIGAQSGVFGTTCTAARETFFHAVYLRSPALDFVLDRNNQFDSGIVSVYMHVSVAVEIIDDRLDGLEVFFFTPADCAVNVQESKIRYFHTTYGACVGPMLALGNTTTRVESTLNLGTSVGSHVLIHNDCDISASINIVGGRVVDNTFEITNTTIGGLTLPATFINSTILIVPSPAQRESEIKRLNSVAMIFETLFCMKLTFHFVRLTYLGTSTSAHLTASALFLR